MGKQERCLGCMEIYESFDSICPYCGYLNGSPPDEMYHLHPGTVLAKRYLLGKVLGFGGFGITYIGWDQLLMRKVAVKEYLPGECSTRIPGDEKVTIFEGEKGEQFYKGIDTFLDEARKLMQFQNLDGIVKVYDCFEENATAYIVMECLEGQTLAKRLGKNDKLSMEETLDMVMPIISALKEIHKTGLIHRDIAPDNIFLLNNGEVKLLDFGSARYIALAQSKSLSVIIKPGYAPPEQYQTHGNQGPWTDVYSLAATIYRMITGIVPEDAMERLAEDTLVPPSKLGIKLLKDQENALLNALNTVVKSRTQSMDELEEQLLSLKAVERQKDGKVVQPQRKKKSVLKVALATAACCAIAVGALFGTGTIKLGGKSATPSDIDYSSGLVGNYVGFNYDDVYQTAIANGVYLEILDTKNQINDQKLKDETIGTIISQTPEAGTPLKDTEGTVGVVLSAGTQTTTVKDFVGLSEEAAKIMAEKNNMKVTVMEEQNSNVVRDYVCAQEPYEGYKVPKGSMIYLAVSKGEKNVDKTARIKMPSLTGKMFEKAVEIAEKKGFYIGIQERVNSTTEEKGTIIDQSVEKGKTIDGGSRVYVTVSDGPRKVEVPDVVGMDIGTGYEYLFMEEFFLVDVEEEYNDDYGSNYAKDTIMKQSLKAGTVVDEGTVIVLTVSKGPKPASSSSGSSKTSSGSSGSSKKSSSSSSKKSSGSSSKKKSKTYISWD